MMIRYYRYILFACCLTYVGFIALYERRTNQEAENTIQRSAEILDLPLWNLDGALALQHGKLISRAEGYHLLRVYHPDGQQFIEVEDHSGDAWFDHALASIHLVRNIPVRSAIVHNGRTIGRIEAVWINRNCYTYVIVLLVMALLLKIFQYYLRLVESRSSLAENNRILNEQIAERLKTERALADETERLTVTLKSIGDGVITANTEGLIVLMNPVAGRMTGWTQEDAIGQQVDDVFRLIDEDTRRPLESPVKRALHTNTVIALASRTKLILKDETERFIVCNCAPIKDRDGVTIGVVLVFQDITAERTAEDERLRISKLESISLLAGGIAHDFNNDLTAILGYVTLAKMAVSPDTEPHEYLRRADEGIQHAKTLARQLSGYAKGSAPIKKLTCIRTLLSDALSLVLSGSNVRKEMMVDEKLWGAEVDADQIIQVIQNLVINAYQAMPDGGVITVRGENMAFETPVNVQGITLNPGFYVKISIIDEGNGIAQTQLPRIFDPYYTTKPIGTGLGLTTAFTMIKRHDGAIAVDSEVGKGTTVTVYIPASSHTEVVSEIKTREPSVLSTHHAGHILVMDDEPLIRALIERILKMAGHSVTCVGDGQEALDRYRLARGAGAPYDAVILDLTIPGGLGGKDTIEQLRAIDPEVKAIVSSGYSDDPVLGQFEQYGFQAMVEKPFRPGQLLDIVTQVLGKS